MTRLFFAKQYHYYNTALKSEKKSNLGKYHRLPQKAKKQNTTLFEHFSNGSAPLPKTRSVHVDFFQTIV